MLPENFAEKQSKGDPYICQQKLKMIAVASIAGASCVSQSLAIPISLPPGGVAPLTAGVVGGPELATTTDAFANGLYSGEIQSWVYDDPAWNDGVNPVGGLTFVYQVRLDDDDGVDLEDISRFTTFTWESFFTAVEQDASSGEAGVDADRDAAPGSTVGFNFAAGFFEGEDSALLIIRSDASAWRPGIGGVINGQTSNVEILAPDRRAVPDGGTTGLLLGLALLSIEGLRRFRG
ncbi:MAG: VPDSG-CTERM sorting domain-containing protein [Verrucomicrobiales bacterium]|nr:VPDSG-CTERM sorting domain-containing protein [Verrucomicrobiales bacterium]